MIYITGDTHGDFTRFSNRHLERKGLHLTAEDYVIVCGDLGLCWAPDNTFAYHCRFFEEKPYTILWVQGNHENYDMLKKYAPEEWNGGMVRHIVRDKVILLERGQVFCIGGKTFFAFGGASSHDIQGGVLDRRDPDFRSKVKQADIQGLPYRILRESWWPEELPSTKEMFEGLKNLGKIDNEVDYIITHCCATGIQSILDSGPGHLYEPDILTDYFEQIEEKIHYKHWYFGHYHMDIKVDSRHTLLYHTIVSLEDMGVGLSGAPMPGKPVYQHGDIVTFFTFRKEKKTGKITVIDAYGTFEQKEEPSYDIHVAEDRCLYKHILESEIIGRTDNGL